MAAPHDHLRFATRRDLSDCVHCGLCLQACPTYLELGQEPDSPRGRVYLMKGLAEQRQEAAPELVRHIDRCLGCRACEPACPSGVGYGHLLEEARGWIERSVGRPKRHELTRDILVGRVMADPTLFRGAMSLLGLATRLGLARLAAPLLPKGFHADRWGRVMRPQRRVPLAPFTPATPPRRGRVAFLTGCVMDGLYGEVNAATVALLAREGWEVVIPKNQVCCGALAAHAGLPNEARRLVTANARAFRAAHDADFLVTNAAGCGAMLKEYDRWTAGGENEQAGRWIARHSRDISELLDLHPLREPPPLEARVAYHDACHLAHGQRITAAPRRLLAQLPGIEIVPLAENDTCCGSAGSYNILQPEMAERLGARKADRIRASGAEIVTAGNMGCLAQIEASLAPAGDSPTIKVRHIVELLLGPGGKT